MSIRLDSRGITQILKSRGVAAAVHDLTEEVATAVRSQVPDAEDVVVDDYITDRAASSVTIRDARGREWQIRDGVLTRAAASAGVEVKSRG